MLTHRNLALHNVVELDDAPGGGVLLRRWPRAVRKTLSPLGRMVAQESAGCELRFVTEAKSFRLSLGALPSALAPHEKHACDVAIFRGAFFHSHHRITPGEINHLNIGGIGEENRFSEIQPEYARGCGFSSEVWRVFFGRYPAVFYDLDPYDGEVRPPRAEEVPAQSWVAYGSSITSGAGAVLHHNGYVYHAARRLGLDVCNLGLSGSCLCEPEVAEYLAACECDVLTLEIGVNMRMSFSPEQFRARAEYLLEKICAAQPQRKVLLITIYPNSATYGIARSETDRSQSEAAFNEILLKLTNGYSVPLIEGSKILDDFSGLTCDLIHPSDYGHARMGHNLATQLQTLL
jgi:lysophospholipase L1-like esterase